MNEVKVLEPKTDFDTGELVSLLTKQRDLCGRLAELAERQRTLIADNDHERLLELLADRQVLVDRFSELSHRLLPCQQKWREIRPRVPAGLSCQVDQLLSDIDSKMYAVLRNDREDAELLSARRNGNRYPGNQLRMNKLAGAAYPDGSNSCQSRMDWTDR